MSPADLYVVVFLLGAGGGIALFWAFALATGKADTFGDFGATRTGHIAAELATAALCLTGGVMRIVDEHGIAATAFAGGGLGGVVYAVLQSGGYYKVKTPWVVPILALTGVAAIPALAIVAAGR